jgi:RNA polymerase sigma-70 factor (ECF subfamily)
MLDIQSLVERWKQGDAQAAEALYNAHRGRAYGLAYSLLEETAEAEDAAQDALIYALTHIARYEPQRASFSTWLHTITVSRCHDRLRRRKHRGFSLTAWLKRDDDWPDPAANQEQHTLKAETRDEVWRAVQSLKLPLREAVVLRFWLGHTYREMAEILGCPVPTAQGRVRLAYQQLQERLAQSGVTQAVDLEEAGYRG